MRNRNRRSGLVLFAALIGIVVAAMLTATMLRTTFLHREVVRDHARRTQAERLAEAGADRGLASLRADDAYSGETWDVPAAQLDGRHAGRVAIELDRAAGTLTATADFPADETRRARASRVVRLPIDD